MRNRVFALIISIILIFTLTACTAAVYDDIPRREPREANENQSDNNLARDLPETPKSDFEYRYVSNFDGVEIIGYTGASIKVNIPETIEGEPVKSIGAEAFKNSGIMEIYMPDGIINIDATAFENCEGLIKIAIPESIVQLDNDNWLRFLYWLNPEEYDTFTVVFKGIEYDIAIEEHMVDFFIAATGINPREMLQGAKITSSNSIAASGASNMTYMLQQEKVKNRGLRSLNTTDTTEATGIMVVFGQTGEVTNVIIGNNVYDALIAPVFDNNDPQVHIDTISWSVGDTIENNAQLISYIFESEFPDAQNSAFYFHFSDEGNVALTLFAPNINPERITPADMAAFVRVNSSGNYEIDYDLLSGGLVTSASSSFKENDIIGSDPKS